MMTTAVLRPGHAREMLELRVEEKRERLYASCREILGKERPLKVMMDAVDWEKVLVAIVTPSLTVQQASEICRLLGTDASIESWAPGCEGFSGISSPVSLNAIMSIDPNTT